MADKYRCKDCGFQWNNPAKEYDKCPDCGSKNFQTVDEVTQMLQAGGRGRMSGRVPRVCKCTRCGYEAPKTPGFPCRNNKCPQCGALLCGAD